MDNDNLHRLHKLYDLYQKADKCTKSHLDHAISAETQEIHKISEVVKDSFEEFKKHLETSKHSEVIIKILSILGEVSYDPKMPLSLKKIYLYLKYKLYHHHKISLWGHQHYEELNKLLKDSKITEEVSGGIHEIEKVSSNIHNIVDERVIDKVIKVMDKTPIDIESNHKEDPKIDVKIPEVHKEDPKIDVKTPEIHKEDVKTQEIPEHKEDPKVDVKISEVHKEDPKIDVKPQEIPEHKN